MPCLSRLRCTKFRLAEVVGEDVEILIAVSCPMGVVLVAHGWGSFFGGTGKCLLTLFEDSDVECHHRRALTLDPADGDSAAALHREDLRGRGILELDIGCTHVVSLVHNLFLQGRRSFSLALPRPLIKRSKNYTLPPRRHMVSLFSQILERKK